MEGLIGARRRLIGDWEVVKMGYREGYILVVIYKGSGGVERTPKKLLLDGAKLEEDS